MGLLGHFTLPTGANVSCASLPVSPVMNYSFLKVYFAFTWMILVCSSGQALVWLTLKIVPSTWFISGFCFSIHHVFWNQFWAQYHFTNVWFWVWNDLFLTVNQLFMCRALSHSQRCLKARQRPVQQLLIFTCCCIYATLLITFVYIFSIVAAEVLILGWYISRLKSSEGTSAPSVSRTNTSHW